MGTSYTPKYVVEISESTPPGCPRCYTTPAEWRVKGRYGRPGHGKPTDANLEKYVMHYAKSLEIGGVNAHISQSLGYIPYPTSAVIRLNQPGAPPIATWKAGAFQVF